MNTKNTGAGGEMVAVKFLESQGVQIVAQNVRIDRNEIDIIYRDSGYLVFCEVKFRNTGNYGRPEEFVDYKKRKIILRMARKYLYINRISMDIPIRFDVIGILKGEINWIKNAFDYTSFYKM